uniref:hypothetical protein n=1 Tax=Cupriavidus necator TaxID=106590 RepID=UPI003FA4B775
MQTKRIIPAFRPSDLARSHAAACPAAMRPAWVFVAEYDLSKRSAVYLFATRMWNGARSTVGANGDVVAPGLDQTGVQVGLRHAF